MKRGDSSGDSTLHSGAAPARDFSAPRPRLPLAEQRRLHRLPLGPPPAAAGRSRPRLVNRRPLSHPRGAVAVARRRPAEAPQQLAGRRPRVGPKPVLASWKCRVTTTAGASPAIRPTNASGSLSGSIGVRHTPTATPASFTSRSASHRFPRAGAFGSNAWRTYLRTPGPFLEGGFVA
jgi:hypothetical protein